MRPAVAYVRVSSLEQKETGYSADGQKRLLWSHAKENGFDVEETFEDNETAGKAGRKNFERMVEYIRQNDIKHVLAEKTDRIYRNFRDYGTLDDLVTQNDLNVHLIKEGVVINKNNTSHEKFIHGIKTLMAKNFLDNLSEEVQKGFGEKLERGEYPGKAPIGYKNVEDPQTKHSVIVIDPDNKDLAVRLFELYASGQYSLLGLIEQVGKENLTTRLPGHRRLTKTSVDRLLRQPFYYGTFYWKGKLYKGSHTALIAFDLWKQVQEVLEGRGCKPKGRVRGYNAIPFVFKNLLICGECGRMVTAEKKKGKYVYYRCTKFGTHCSQGPVKEEALDGEFKKILGRFQYDDELIEYVTAGLKQSLGDKREMEDKAYDVLLKEKETLRKRNDALYEDKLDGKIGEDKYAELFNRYSGRILEIDQRLSSYFKAEVNYYDFGQRILELAKKAEFLYENATITEKNQIASFLLSNSTLKNGKPEFALKQPFAEILKRSPLEERSRWGGQWESNPY